MLRIKNKKPIIGITLGDPAGIGPEVLAKALTKPSIRRLAQFKIIGDHPTFHHYCGSNYKNVDFLDPDKHLKIEVKIGQPNSSTAMASLSYIKKAIILIKQKEIHAIVTAPVCKEAISALGKNFCGHTEFLAQAFGIKNFDMMFVGGPFKTIVVTRHIPLKKVSKTLTKEKIYKTICLTHTYLIKFFKIKHPKIAVCGLNPHAGEGGAIGDEELTQIIPAIQKAKKAKIDVRGPFPADTIFFPGINQSYDVILAMYHDQGLIPVKTVAFNKLVNVTIGLPFIRTSPAHGTAFNIAGRNIANPDSMIESIKLAAQLSEGSSGSF